MKYLLGKSFKFHYGTNDYRSNYDAINWKDDEPKPPPKSRTIKRNAAKCLSCGDIIESKHRHDFVSCKCHNIAVDGGLDYIRRCGNLEGYEDMSEYED